MVEGPAALGDPPQLAQNYFVPSTVDAGLHDPNLMQPGQVKQNADELKLVHNPHDEEDRSMCLWQTLRAGTVWHKHEAFAPTDDSNLIQFD